MNPLLQKRRRILLLFIFGVGAPSLVLGYLAFRGIRNDQALLEKQNREELRLTAGQAAAEVEKNISVVEQDFERLLAGRDDPLSQDAGRDLRMFMGRTPLVEEVFLYQGNGTILFPAKKFLYVPDGSLETEGPPAESVSNQKRFLAGQQAEFQGGNFARAASIYRQIFHQVKNRRMRGQALNALARVLRKDSHYTKAITAYRNLMEDFGEVRSSSGVPLGPAAGHELAALYAAAKDQEKALRTYVDVFRDLAGNKWVLEKTQYEFYAQRTLEAIEAVLSVPLRTGVAAAYRNEIHALKIAEATHKTKTERLLSFQENGPSEIRRIISMEPRTFSGRSRRGTIDRGGQSYLVSFFGPDPGKIGRDERRWGLLIDPRVLASEVIKKALERNAPPDTTGWVVKDGNGEILLSSGVVPSGSMEFSSSFSGRFPDWRLELHSPDPRLFETFLTSGRSVYLIAFLLIGGILVFGLALTIRAVSQELELSRLKSDFVSTVSHEFKSPLTSIRHLAEMLQTGRVASEERRRKYYDVLVEQSERLTRLTENVLDLARMEEGRKEFKFEPVDIAALLKDIIRDARERLCHEGFELELRMAPPLPSLMADGAALTQAVDNLLDNAVKYSGGAKKAVISAEFREGEVVVSVHDFGLGIKKEEQDKVFERFYRGGDELTRMVKGSGLGLTLVKKIAEAHRGNIRLESEPGRGSTFSLRLPAKQQKDVKHG